MLRCITIFNGLLVFVTSDFVLVLNLGFERRISLVFKHNFRLGKIDYVWEIMVMNGMVRTKISLHL
jgi:hypothetical protein